MAGAMAAMADPPQIPVPAEISPESFQFMPKIFPRSHPPPKAVNNVKTITIREYFPTCSTCEKLRVSPINIIENLNICFETKFIPGLKKPNSDIYGFRIIPASRAKTLPLIRW